MKGLFHKIGKAFQLIHYNRIAFWGFEILFKLLTITLVLPLSQVFITLVMKVTGYPYLTMENVKHFFLHPLVELLIPVLLLLVVIYNIIDASAVLYLMDRSYQKKKVTILQTTRFAFCNTGRLFQIANLKIIFFGILFLPYISLGEIGILATTVMIPNFISSALQKNRNLVIIVLIYLFLMFVILLNRIYCFHFFTLEQKNYQDSIAESKRLAKGKRWKDGSVLAGVQITFYLFSFIVAGFGIVLVLGVAKLFSEFHLLNYVYTSAVWGLILVVILLVGSIATPLSAIAVTTLFYLHKESKGEAVIHNSLVIERMDQKHQKRIRLIELCVFLVTAFMVTELVYMSSTQKVSPQIEYFRTMEVTAHRGASAFFPENTMAAFQGALDFSADWIELDVQQSKDKQVFVMHDRSFFRTTGVRKMSWELDYSEIEQLDAGSFFSQKYAGERIPLLEEVIDFAKENNIRLNIELKPGSQDVDIEKRVVDIIVEKEFQDQCVVTSQVYECLQKVKSYNEEILTVYVTSFAYGNVIHLSAADAFSVEASSITPGMVSRIHNAGKQIYAWTVNSRKRINRMIDLNVDNIITDRVALAQECIYKSMTSTVIQRYVDFLREYR